MYLTTSSLPDETHRPDDAAYLFCDRAVTLRVGDDRNPLVAEHRPQAFPGRRMHAAAIGDTAIDDSLQTAPPFCLHLLHWMASVPSVGDPAPPYWAKHCLMDGGLLQIALKKLKRKRIIVYAPLVLRDPDAVPAAVAPNGHHPTGGICKK